MKNKKFLTSVIVFIISFIIFFLIFSNWDLIKALISGG